MMMYRLKIKFMKLLSVFLLAVFSSGMVSLYVHADTQRIVNYDYDGAGNIISIRSGQILGPPDVTNLSPAFIHKDSFAFVTATGINLTNAEVTINTTGISLTDVTHVSETEIKLTLFAGANAQIGLAPITFTTRLGSDIENIAVAERTPVVSTDPNPIILSPDSQNILVRLTFDRPFASDQIYDLKITDETIATVSNRQITLPAGKTEVSTGISGLTAGVTALEINQLSNFLALGIPVLVIEEQLPAGNYTHYTDPVGVSAFVDQTTNTTAGLSVAQPVGVVYMFEHTSETTGPFVTSTVGITFGTAVGQVTPQSIVPPDSVTLTIDGTGLDAVTAVSFSPSEGITQNAVTTNFEGTQMTISIDVAANAPTGSRTVILTTSDGNTAFSNAVFEITN